MTIPGFSAHASLYRTSNHYRGVGNAYVDSPSADSVVTAFIPGPETLNRCSGCTTICDATRTVCLTKAAATTFESCAASLFIGCGPAIALGALQAEGCEASHLECFGDCNIPTNPLFESPCCPKVCGPPIPPGKGGAGCCDHGEVCANSGPNTRDGCCPAGQFCGGNCCAVGDRCCGTTCCPPDKFCLANGECTSSPPFSNNPPPPPPPFKCPPGAAPCGLPDKTGVVRTCCPPGLQCCNVINGQPDCKTSCLH